VCVCVGERERERVCVCERERERVCVCGSGLPLLGLMIEFYPTHQIFPPRLTAHACINIASFSHAEQQYLMYLHYCKGVFRVGVGVDVNKTQSNR